MMGPGIALTLALGGVPATIVSRTAESAAQGVEKARERAQFLAHCGLLEVAVAARAASLAPRRSGGTPHRKTQ